jgi:GrpB-like predicted nucleotidyltransferase (UPF0157 family)
MQGVERYKVRLLPHDNNWKVEFLEAKAQIENIWTENVLDIQHFGSTSIVGIYAKPILDVAVVLKSLGNMDIDAMTQAGYDYCGAQNPEKSRYLFVLRGENQISLRHLHCYEPGDEDFRLCVGFRDYLNSHPEDAQKYSELKLRLAEKYPDDRFAYTDEKLDFVQSIYAKLAGYEVSVCKERL